MSKCPLGGGNHRANGSGKALLAHDERIRELEAKLAESEAHVAELEAELAAEIGRSASYYAREREAE